jgi:hypothetical protein
MEGSLLVGGACSPSRCLKPITNLYYTSWPSNELRGRFQGARWAKTQRTSCQRGGRLRAVRAGT